MSKTSTVAAAPPSTKDRLAGAKLPERTVDICLRGDLQAEWEDLHRQLADAQAVQARDKRLNSGKAVEEIGQQITAVQEQMRADTIVFRLRALPRRRWTELLKGHPARKDHDEDGQIGFNGETFAPAAIRACTYSPDDLDDETWADLLDNRLTEHQFAELTDAMFALNVRKVSIPNSFAASQILRSSERG